MRDFATRICSIFLMTLILVFGVTAIGGDKHKHNHKGTVTFEKGSSDLTTDDQAALKDLINGVGLYNVDRVELAVWSDKSFPRSGTDLPKADRDLADNRITRIKDFINDLKVSTINTYNMAETTNWLARTMKTDDAELKSVFSKEAAIPLRREDFNIIVNEGAPSKAVVVVVHKKMSGSKTKY